MFTINGRGLDFFFSNFLADIYNSLLCVIDPLKLLFGLSPAIKYQCFTIRYATKCLYFSVFAGHLAPKHYVLNLMFETFFSKYGLVGNVSFPEKIPRAKKYQWSRFCYHKLIMNNFLTS